MRLAVLGATGRTGVPLVRQALEAGHQVSALVRSEDKARELLPVDDAGLELVVGDLRDAGDVGRLVDGVDAVVDTSGPPGRGAPEGLRRDGARVLVDAMRQAGVRRLVGLTGAGVPLPEDRPKLPDKAFRLAMRTLFSKVMTDSKAYVDVVQAADLDWTVVRGPRLVDKPGRGLDQVRVSPSVGVNSGTTLSREDLAALVLKLAVEGGWERQSPVASW